MINGSRIADFFQQLLTDEDLKLFRASSSVVRYHDTSFFVQDENCDKVYFIEEGGMRIFRLTEEGREITLYRIGPGEICLLSLNSTFSPLPFSSSAVIEGETSLLSIPVEIYRGIFSRNALLQQYVMENVMKTLNSVMTLSEEIAFHSVEKRVAAKILELKDRQKSMVLKTRHEDIARDLGTAREVVSRVLKNFTDEGIVCKTRGRLEIFDEEKLEKIISA